MKIKKRNRVLSLLLVLVMAVGMLPVTARADWPYMHEWNCPYCDETFTYGSYTEDFDLDKAMDFFISEGKLICSGCYACESCPEWAHCSQCGACTSELIYDDYWCAECNICADCMYMHDDHCQVCRSHFGDESGPECDECDLAMCMACHVVNDMSFCYECGACMYGKFFEGEACPKYSDDDRYQHCADHCEGTWCNECGDCFFTDGGLECNECYTCAECIEELELHCFDCGECFLGPAERCNENNNYVLCVECCIEANYHCFECDEHVADGDWCPTGGEYSHCMSNCEGESCDKCDICFECANVEICPECELCADCCAENTVSANCTCEMCVKSSEFEDHVCPECGDPACVGGDDLCEDCGLCETCCEKASEDAGCSCEMCAKSPDFEDEDHRCKQCEEKFVCSDEFCNDCGLCVDCCIENAEDANCSCGDPVCIESVDWADHYCESCNHCVEVCDCDPSCECEQCGVGVGFEHTHEWDTEGYCTRCGASADGNPVITVQPRKEIHGTVSNYRENYYDNTFTVAVRVREGVKLQWYRSTSPTGTGVKLENNFDVETGSWTVQGADTQELTTYIPVDACTTTYYYYCVVTNPENGKEIRSDSAELVARHKHRTVVYDADKHVKQCVGQDCDDGYDASTMKDHSFGPNMYVRYPTTTATGLKKTVCGACGYEKSTSIPKLDPNHIHNYQPSVLAKNPGTGHSMMCDCGVTLGSVRSHVWGSWDYVKYATVTTAGERKHTCKECGYTASEKIAALRNHEHFSYEQEAAQEAAEESGNRQKYYEYLHLYRENYNTREHWFVCDVPGCNMKFAAAPHEWTVRVFYPAKPATYNESTGKLTNHNGRVWYECKTCPQVKTLDYAYGTARVVVSNGKASQSQVTRTTTFNIEAKVPEGHRFVRWELKNGGGKDPYGKWFATIADPNDSETTVTYDRKFRDKESGKILGMDFKGDELIWIHAVTEERDPYVFLTNPKTGKTECLNHGQSLLKDGTVINGGFEDNPNHIAYFFDDNILYLHDYVGDKIELRAYSTQDFTIILQGKNVINASTGNGIICNEEFGGNLTIATDEYYEEGSLEINFSKIEGKAIGTSSSARGKYNVTLDGAAQIKINSQIEPRSGQPKENFSYGIFATGEVRILEQAGVEIVTNGPGIKPTLKYTVYGLYAGNNITVKTDGEVNIEVGNLGFQNGAAICAKNVFFDYVDWSELKMGTDLTGEKVLPAIKGKLTLSDDLALHKYEPYEDRHDTVISNPRLLKLPEGEGYTVHVMGDHRVDEEGSLIAHMDDVVKVRVELEPGYYFTSKARALLKAETNDELTPARTATEYRDYHILIPNWNPSTMLIRGVGKIDPFKSVSSGFTAHPRAAVSLAYAIRSDVYKETLNRAKGKNAWIYVEKQSGGTWGIVEGGSAKLSASGRVTFTDPNPASEGKKDVYRFALPIGNELYYSDTIEVTRTKDTAEVYASAVELYLRGGWMSAELAANGYPQAYDDGRTWVRLDAEHDKLYRYTKNGVYVYSYTNQNGVPAASFDAETGTLTLYRDGFHSNYVEDADIGAIRTPATSTGNLTINTVGGIMLSNDVTTYYREGGEVTARPTAAISNPTGAITFTTPDADTTGWLQIFLFSEPDDTKTGGKLTGFTSVGVDAQGDVVLMNKAEVDIYPESETTSTDSTMQKFIGIRSQGDIVMEGSSTSEIIMRATGFDQAIGFLAGDGKLVHITDAASPYMELCTDGDSPHTFDSSCIVADECNVYTSAKSLYFNIEQNNPGTPRGINVSYGSELDLSWTNLVINVYSADRGGYCFGGSGTIGFQSAGHTCLHWMDVDDKAGAAFEQTSVYGLDSGDITVLDPYKSTHDSITEHDMHIVDGTPRTVSVKDSDGNFMETNIIIEMQDGTKETFNNISIKESVTVPAGKATVRVFLFNLADYDRYVANSDIPVTLENVPGPRRSYRFTMPDCDVELIACSKDQGDKVLTGIAVTRDPNKKTYVAGESFDPDGMEVTARYSDGTSKVVTDNATMPTDALTTGDTSVTIRYTENGVTVTKEYPITVTATARSLTGIAVTQPPAKTEYKVGERFSKNGMEVTASYSDGTSKVVTGYTVSPSGTLKLGDTSVTISYTEGGVTKTASQPITVTQPAKSLSSIKVTTMPDKTIYTDEESFDDTGLVITAKYSDGTEAPVTSYTVTPSGPLKAGATSVTVSYTEGGVTKAVAVPITVNASDSVAPAINASSSTLPSATVGSAYEHTLKAAGSAPFEWKVTEGELPAGLTLSSDGKISGVPTASGTKTVTVEAKNAFGTDTREFTITVAPESGGGGGITTRYTLTYNTNGGSAVASTKHNSGATVSLTATPVREGYTFTGWYADSALTSKITSIKMVGNKTVYAGWKEGTKPVDPSPAGKFTDVPADAWYEAAVDYVADKGLMVGTSADKFSPEVTTSRAMIVTILHRLEGKPAASGKASFDDVVAGSWYADAVAWAEEHNIVEGYGNGKFGPNDLITREQFAAILYRYANFKGYNTSKSADLSGYADASAISDWALAAMKWANAEKLITGRTATTLVPKGEATRAEAAAILKRFIENVK